MKVFKSEIKKTLILGFNYDDMSFDHCLAFYSVVLADRVRTFRRMEVTFPNQLWAVTTIIQLRNTFSTKISYFHQTFTSHFLQQTQ
jgi:hypothetical protein